MKIKILSIFLILWFFSLHAEEPLSVVIIGGGPSGLATAIEAQQKGAHVTIFEKRLCYSRYQTLLLFDPSLELLDHWQVICPQMKVSTVNGKRIGFVHINDLEKSLAQRVNELGIRILCGEYEDIKAEESKAILATCEGEICVPYDILVGADGTHSLVRETAGIKVHRYGKGMGAFALVSLEKPGEIAVETNQQNGVFIRRIAIPPRLSLMFSQSEKISQHHFAQAARGSGWLEEARLIEEGKALAYTDGIEVVLQQAQHFSNECEAIILVGDAAASTSFFEGMGANTAFRTAVLAGNFIEDVQYERNSAYCTFEHRMQETTDQLIEGSRYLFSQ